MAHLTDVRVGRHSGFDRVVFEFGGPGVPALALERVSPPFEKDPSGLPLRVPGTSFVRVQLVDASGEGYATVDGTPTYTGPATFKPRYPRLTSLVRAGDYEGYVTWIAGLTGRTCVRVLALSGPARLVIDFQAP